MTNLPKPGELIAHTDIALVLDELTELEPGKYARGLWMPDERYFEGHFKGNPILPAHWSLESVALAGACALLSSRPGILPYFRESRMMLKEMVRPGSTLELEATFGSVKEDKGMIIAEGKGSASVEGKKVLVAPILKAVAMSLEAQSVETPAEGPHIEAAGHDPGDGESFA